MNVNFLPDDKEYITIGIRFGAKDEDLRSWVESIPKGRFSLIIKDCIRAYINNEQDFRLPCGDMKASKQKSIQKSVYIGKMDGEIYDFISSIDRSLRSNEIKKILRRLGANLFTQGKEVDIANAEFTHYLGLKQKEPARKKTDSSTRKKKLDQPETREKTLPDTTPPDDKEEAFYAKSLLRTAKMYNQAVNKGLEN
jgi:hypothetical protein